MIIGIGIDIVEIDRMATAIQRESFVDRVFAAEEKQYCENRGANKAASYAARFAAKEAVVKALGTGFNGGKWQDIYVLLDKLGQPHVRMTGYYHELAKLKGVTAVFLSLTHAREYAAAQVVMWGEGKQDENSNS